MAIVGVGLIGGSIGLTLRRRGLADRVIGLGRDPTRLDEATRLGAIDEATTVAEHAVAEAEVVVICTPVTRVADDVIQLAALADPKALITDAGSTKRTIVAAVEADPRGRAVFVGAHPIAGSERSGVENARTDLFEGRVCALTPTASTAPDQLQLARSYWSSLGCRLVEMTPTAHDDALALTSHLPHVVAAALASSVPEEVLPLAAGAYRDGTRVAAADPDLWTGILLQNREPVLHALLAFHAGLNVLTQALRDGDSPGLRSLLADASARREGFESERQSS